MQVWLVGLKLNNSILAKYQKSKGFVYENIRKTMDWAKLRIEIIQIMRQRAPDYTKKPEFGPESEATIYSLL